MKTCRDCALFNNCIEPYTESEIEEYTTGDIRTLCKLFDDAENYVKVIRCKDCVHYMHKSGRCWRMCFPMGADDYCSSGERKTDNE